MFCKKKEPKGEEFQGGGNDEGGDICRGDKERNELKMYYREQDGSERGKEGKYSLLKEIR